MKSHFLIGRIALLLTVILLPGICYAQEVTAQDTVLAEPEISFADALITLGNSPLSKAGKAIEKLSNYQTPRKIVVLQALLTGKLVKSKSDGEVLIVEEADQAYRIFSALTGERLGIVEPEAVKQIKLSNRLRAQLRLLVAEVRLKSEDPQLRLQAVKDLAKKPDNNAIMLLQALREHESDPEVLDELAMFFALQDLDSRDQAVKLAAIEFLKDKTSLEAMNRLTVITEKDEKGNYLETDKAILKQAKSALAKIQSRLQMYETAETVFFGISLGAVLVLAAIGLTITFGVMGVINMAHGELMMLGAYTTYVMQQIMPNNIGLALLLSVPAAFMVSGMVGIGIERGIIRFLYGRPLETLLATFGVSLFLQQTVRSIFSPLNRSVSAPEFMSGSWQINEFLSFTWNRLYIIIFCLLVFAILLQVLKRTKLGLEVRAVSQNRTMAKAMGIPTDRVDAMTFGLGSGIAGVAGVALSQITNVGPNLGQAYIVDSFMVVVFGGVGNLSGTLVAGFSLGLANKVLEPFAGAVLAKIIVLVFIILFIQKRPRGLFPQKGRAAES